MRTNLADEKEVRDPLRRAFGPQFPALRTEWTEQQEPLAAPIRSYFITQMPCGALS